MPVSLVLGNPALDPALLMCLVKSRQRWRITSLDLLATFFLMQSRMVISLCTAGSWPTVGPPGLPGLPLQSCLSAIQSPACTAGMELFLPRCWPACSLFLDFLEDRGHMGTSTLFKRAITWSSSTKTKFSFIQTFSQVSLEPSLLQAPDSNSFSQSS